MDSAFSLIVVLVLVDLTVDVVVANLVRQRQRVIVDLPAHHAGWPAGHRPAEPPRSVRSLVLWFRMSALVQVGSLVVLVHACLVDLSGFGAEPLPDGRPLLITAIVAGVLFLVMAPGIVLIGRGLLRGKPVEWRYLVRSGRSAPAFSAVIGAAVIGACLILTVPEPVQDTVVGVYLVNIMVPILLHRPFLHLDTWLWFGPPTRRVDDEVSER